MADGPSQFHHRRSIRLKGYDYTQAGAYFITMVTQKRQCLFGEIGPEAEILLNQNGLIAWSEWERLPERFPFIELGAFVVMPNHVHGIIIIRPDGARGDCPRAPTAEKFSQPVRGSIPTIVRSYKSSVTQRIASTTKGNPEIVWQRNYYERVVRCEAELDRISRYILANPIHWRQDDEYPDKP
jgi:REP element-mobilizing transposase RayT